MHGNILTLLAIVLLAVSAEPLYGYEKALLFSFEDPRDIEWVSPKEDVRPAPTKRRTRFLNLMGQNTRFLKPFLEKKEREEKMRAERQAKQIQIGSPDCLAPSI